MPSGKPITPILPADTSGIAVAAEQIRAGGLVVYPTETVYGLGADPFSTEGLNRIFAVKEREADKALILLIRGPENLNALTAEVPQTAQDLMDAFWPGPLTLVFQARPGLPERLMGARSTIALRVSDAPAVQTLLDRTGGPITSTSANRSGDPPARSASEAASALGDRVDLILDGGPAADARPSTLVDVSVEKIKILREGQIASEAVYRVLGRTAEQYPPRTIG